MIILVMLFSLLQQDDDDDVVDVCIQLLHICIHTVCTMFKMFNKQILQVRNQGNYTLMWKKTRVKQESNVSSY